MSLVRSLTAFAIDLGTGGSDLDLGTRGRGLDFGNRWERLRRMKLLHGKKILSFVFYILVRKINVLPCMKVLKEEVEAECCYLIPNNYNYCR